MYKWCTYFNAVVIVCSLLVCEANRGKIQEAHINAQTVTINFFTMFDRCLSSSMPNQQFLLDNIQNFINYPSKTTVGFAPKFTSNRKFFANMLGTAAFKEMLANDEDELRRDMIKKMKYCDEAVMDKDLLKDFYDREVDQSKI